MIHESRFGDDELIVSKTDPQGRITWANEVFCRVSGFTPEEIIGKPHNCIRHPAMPRGLFRILWDTLLSKEEVFAFVVNRTRSGGWYWVFAHVTPSFDPEGKLVGYHSNRRTPNRLALPKVTELYRAMQAEEARHGDRREAAAAGARLALDFIRARKQSWNEWMFELERLS